MHVHAPEPAAPVHDWCVPQLCVLVTSRQLFPSSAHVRRIEVPSQTVPVLLSQLALLLQVHAPEPAAPVHVSSDGHATGVPYE